MRARRREAQPGHSFSKPLQRLLRHHETLRAEVVTKKVESLRNTTDEGLVRVFVQAQRGKCFVQLPNGTPQLPARGREHQYVVHVAHVEEPRGFEAGVQLAEEERSQQWGERGG